MVYFPCPCGEGFVSFDGFDKDKPGKLKCNHPCLKCGLNCSDELFKGLEKN
jgi:hypothetical protein